MNSSFQITSRAYTIAWTYDDFGSRLTQTGQQYNGNPAPPEITLSYGEATNRITTSGYTYDLNGNLTAMPGITGIGWDVFDRMSGTSVPGTTRLFSYDAFGRRMDSGTYPYGHHIYFYDTGGRLLAEYGNVYGGATPTKKYEYFAGQQLGQYKDRVGSVRSTNGGVSSHYYPFGEEITSTANDRYKFAETYRDADSGLDYALNRYYAAGIGRFLSVDPFGRSAVTTNPQSWNRYAYVLGDPVNGTDPTGLVTYFSCDYGSEGFGKCGWRYAPDGGAGETSVGGGPTGAPYDSTSSELVRSLLKARLKGFADSNCGKLFAQAGIDVTKLTADGSTVRAFDARSTSVYQNVTHAAATGSKDTTTLANLPGAASTSALALTGPRPAIALYADFFGPPNLGSLPQSDQDAFKWEQENVALHELVHVSAGLIDKDIFGTSLFVNNGLDTRDYEQFGNTGAFTDWLKRDCKPPQ